MKARLTIVVWLFDHDVTEWGDELVGRLGVRVQLMAFSHACYLICLFLVQYLLVLEKDVHYCFIVGLFEDTFDLTAGGHCPYLW